MSASIKISRLPEILVNRVTPNDYFIINDGDIVTSKISFKTLVSAISSQNIAFDGNVVFLGDVTGDFYNKDEVYTNTEVDAIINNLTQNIGQTDERVAALVELSGRPPLSSHLGVFTGGIIPDSATVRLALEALEEWAAETRNLIGSGSDTDAINDWISKHSLQDHVDVNLASPVEGDYFVYKNGKWTNEAQCNIKCNTYIPSLASL